MKGSGIGVGEGAWEGDPVYQAEVEAQRRVEIEIGPS